MMTFKTYRNGNVCNKNEEEKRKCACTCSENESLTRSISN